MSVATVTKSIGSSGRKFSTLQSWEDGAPANLVTSEKWTASTFVGTFTQGETVTGTGLTAGKFLDSDQSSYVTFGIVTGNSATLTTLTGSSSGATCVVSAKTDTGIIWKGETYNDSVFTLSGAGMVVAGSTTNSTCYKELTTATGQSFADVSSRALRYISGSGVSIEGTGSYSTMFASSETYARFSLLQLKSGSTSTYSPMQVTGTGARVEKMIIDHPGSQSAFAICKFSGDFIANVLMMRRTSTLGAGMTIEADAKVENVSIVFPAGGNTVAGFAFNYSSGSIVKNCTVFGFTSAYSKSGAGTPTFNNCYTDIASPPSGWTGSTAYSTATFNSVTSGSENLRIVSGSALENAGTTATNASTDIFGTSRPQGASYDVGPHELVATSSFIATKSIFAKQAVNRSNTY